MIINYDDIFWGDSTLEKIEICYDRIVMSVYNDILHKMIFIKCTHCVGITELLTWDENIIDNIFLNRCKNENHILKKAYELYGDEAYDSEKNLIGDFVNLKVVLINNDEFCIICKSVDFSDDYL